MARMAIVGAGHVGVVHAAMFAELGHRVAVVDVDARKVARLRAGDLWFHEPGLPELLRRGLRRRLVTFTTSYATALRDARFVVVCVPTPTTPEGSLDDSALRAAFESIKQHVGAQPPIVVNKSTVPVGTGDAAARIFRGTRIKVASNPEFLAEGRALEDSFHPHRVVIGSRDRATAVAVAELYRPLGAPIVITDPISAELAKLAANAFLATKISFANGLARIAEALDADMEAIARALAHDPRIGPGHLQAGLGFGGSCLPKDIAAMEHLARRFGAPYELFTAVSTINRGQRHRAIDYLAAELGTLAGKRIAVLGAAFKANTDDTRESPAVALSIELVAQGAEVRTHDPVVRQAVPGCRQASSPLAAARGADAVVVATEWPEYARLDLRALRTAMRGRIIIDGRGIFDPSDVRSAGLNYFGYGRGGRARKVAAGSKATG